MKNITIIETALRKDRYWENIPAEEVIPSGEMQKVSVFPKQGDQHLRGFGGAFTEAAAHTLKGLSEENREQVIEDLFGESGLRYTMGRIHMNSCDFALGNYNYIREGDESLDSFDISHDEEEIIPMLRMAQDKMGKPITLLMAPWSPPPFMKTNGEMNHGGKLKKEYYSLWARYFVRFIQEYGKRGFPISFTTIQNEPNATQTWDSCTYDAQEEGEFAVEYLGPALKEAGLLDQVKILVWDHNKEIAFERLDEILKREGAKEYISGCAVHWYTGDHFENLDLIRRFHPDQEIFFTEGCIEYSRLAGESEIRYAELYAHDMMGNLNHGVDAIFDWNMLLDYYGGPNHVGNYCDAPIKALENGVDYEKKLSYYYIGQLSRFVKPGAQHIPCSRYTDKVDVSAFVNPDGERVAVLLNRTEEDIKVNLSEGEQALPMMLPAHSIRTVCWS
ncbi:MAG: glucosylceramidase [Lachnospiraceae bacterium]|nr:glucosylceramidase [Lachnospiraceae bacterium]